MQLQDDRYYIEQVLSGQTRLYSVLVDRHKQMVYSFVLKMLGSPEDAEETAHDAFVKAYQSLPAFRFQCKFSTWLYRIAYNESVSRLRKKKYPTVSIEEPGFQNLSLSDTNEALEAITRDEQEWMLNRAMETLPEEERSIISLFYLQECPVKDIAEITGLTESNVKIKLFRARKRLWEKLQWQMDDQVQITRPHGT